MEFFMAIAPLVFVGVIVVFVITRLKHKQYRENQGKKKSKNAQVLLDSFIPLGLIFGCSIGVVFGMLFQISFLYTISFGAGIGYLLGYFGYEFYCKREGIYK
ncbi:hypothetical protein ACERII_13110 [Evansella sp. AB-rgal1]|uniref:hypothetical protein n=1 Tax=Evansella sp. AB-rgal1 TaxID=3242696 RepID=UPI00359D2CE8